MSQPDKIENWKDVNKLHKKAFELYTGDARLNELLKYPNQEDTFGDFVEAWCTFKLVTGNSFVYAKMIDPLTALAGIQSAISMVKKASKVANDLGSLAPMIGKMFDAKSTATKALIEAKNSKKGSNMGTALQIEMALEQARAFEDSITCN